MKNFALTLIFACLVGFTVQDVRATDSQDRIISLIENCKWNEAADLIESGINPFGIKSPFTANVLNCFNSINNLVVAYTYRSYPDAFRVLKASVLHPDFKNYSSNEINHSAIDYFFGVLISGQDYSSDNKELLLELEKRSLIEFKNIPQNLINSKDEVRALKYIKTYVLKGGSANSDVVFDMSSYPESSKIIDKAIAYNKMTIVSFLLDHGAFLASDSLRIWLKYVFHRGEDRNHDIEYFSSSLSILFANDASAIISENFFYFDYIQGNEESNDICSNFNRDRLLKRKIIIRELLLRRAPVDVLDAHKNYLGHNLLRGVARGYQGRDGICSNQDTVKDILEMLITSGYNVNWVDRDGETLLHRAISGRWPLEVVSFLMKNKADKTIKTNRGYSAIDISTGNDPYFVEVRKILKKKY